MLPGSRELALQVVSRNLAIKPLLNPVTPTKTKSDFLQVAVYKTFTAGDLKKIAGRKWRCREGTLAEEQDRRDEEKEAEEFPTQVRGHCSMLPDGKI